jgi:hypothetical protein
MVKINVKNILLTKPIVDAARVVNPSFSPKGFKQQPGEQGFPLSRLEENLKKTGTAPDIVVKAYEKVPGYYSVIDGRHRVAIAIGKGQSEIDAEVQSGGKTRRRRRRSNLSLRRRTRPSSR